MRKLSVDEIFDKEFLAKLNEINTELEKTVNLVSKKEKAIKSIGKSINIAMSKLQNVSGGTITINNGLIFRRIALANKIEIIGDVKDGDLIRVDFENNRASIVEKDSETLKEYNYNLMQEINDSQNITIKALEQRIRNIYSRNLFDRIINKYVL